MKSRAESSLVTGRSRRLPLRYGNTPTRFGAQSKGVVPRFANSWPAAASFKPRLPMPLTPKEFFVAESVRIARSSLSYCDFLTFLRGMLEITDEAAEVEGVRAALQQIEGGDDQLELIASGRPVQQRLNLDGAN